MLQICLFWKQTSNTVNDQKNEKRSKTNEKHWKPLRIAFHDQRPKRMLWQIVCWPNLCQNASNYSKLAHKRPKRSNSTKIEMRLKTSKTATECLKPLGNGFLWPSTKTNSSFKKNFFLIKVVQKRPKSFRTCSETTNTVKQHKILKLVENVQNCSKLTLAASNLKLNISCVMTKRFKLFKTYYETTETTKIHKKLKYGQKRQKS